MFLVAQSMNLNDGHHEEEDRSDPNKTITCELYDPNGCKKNCPTSTQCDDKNGPQACYAVWKTDNRTELPIVQMKGCMIIHEGCFQDNCIDESSMSRSGNTSFCCCHKNSCNKNFVWIPKPMEPSSTEDSSPEDTEESFLVRTKWIWASGLIVAVIGFCLTSKYLYHQRKQMFNELPTMEPEISVSSQCLVLRQIDLLEMKAHGRFGTVWKANMLTENVAVKVFPTQEKQSWITEQEIYRLPRMNHANILHFIGAEKHIFPDGKTNEFWLISEYHNLGSLCDYLKCHTVSWQDLCKISESMARGLAHLHEEILGTRSDDLKPAIAHRDFKSKNVLLKSDLTACVADFGLALRFTPGQPCGDVHGQVGTRRYMAPEILEGAINFNRDSFLRIDVYACGLVLWELVSRCTAHGGPVAEYRLPFEAELGSHPTLEEMQDNIAAKKLRPKLYPEWRQHTVSSNQLI